MSDPIETVFNDILVRLLPDSVFPEWRDRIVGELVAAHRAGQRTEHRPDLIDADGYRWDWTSDEGYQGPLGFCLPSREDVDDFCGPVTEAEETD